MIHADGAPTKKEFLLTEVIPYHFSSERYLQRFQLPIEVVFITEEQTFLLKK